MRRIKIKNLGPIKEGIAGDGYLDISKLTVLIGNQGTGKSTVAKIISTLTWLEKALTRGYILETDITLYNRFVKQHCAYQGISNYFNESTFIEYTGHYYTFTYISKRFYAKKNDNVETYASPKIMYIPAERNFLSVADRPDRLRGLPPTLYTFLEEFQKSLSNLSKEINLPLSGTTLEYQKQNRISYIKGGNYRIRLSEASSGIQSLVPVYLVSEFLSSQVLNKSEETNQSLKQAQRISKEIRSILREEKISPAVRASMIDFLSKQYTNSIFINIVEEIEQNLFPSTQKEILFKLLSFNNLVAGNELILTTHSPYIINYLTIASKAGYLKQKIEAKQKLDLLGELAKTVPLESCVNLAEVSIFELAENGNILKLPSQEGVPSDSNYLNKFLEDSNQLFDNLLDVEEKL